MNTPSHLIMMAAFGKWRRQQAKSFDKAAYLGSIAPDIPLILISIAYVSFNRWVSKTGNKRCSADYDWHYFNDPLWIISHNTLHSPLPLALLIAAGYFAQQRGKRWGQSLLWFGLGCAGHSLIDIPTHHNDGPLLFFPFDFKTRYNSALSYWHPEHGGRWFKFFEASLDIGLLAYIFGGNSSPHHES